MSPLSGLQGWIAGQARNDGNRIIKHRHAGLDPASIHKFEIVSLAGNIIQDSVRSHHTINNLFAPMVSETTITEITYLYRDAGNFKWWGSFRVKGEMVYADLREFLFDGEFFVPSELGLQGLQPEQRTEDDHELHSFEEFMLVRGKEWEVTKEELIQRLKSANERGWFRVAPLIPETDVYDVQDTLDAVADRFAPEG